MKIRTKLVQPKIRFFAKDMFVASLDEDGELGCDLWLIMLRGLHKVIDQCSKAQAENIKDYHK